MEWFKMFSIYAALISGVFALSLGIYNIIQAKKWRRLDKQTFEQNRKEDKQEIQLMWEKQKRFNGSLAPLVVEVQLNQNIDDSGRQEVKQFELRTQTGEIIGVGETNFLNLFVNSGWLSKIYVIDSCFKDESNPFIDMTKYYNNAQIFGEEIKKGVQSGGSLWVDEDEKKLSFFNSNFINFYPEINLSVFYQFYLIEGANKQVQLFMFGCDKIGEEPFPFVFDRRGIASTINSVNESFRKEYLALSDYLEKMGYKL